jgi:hypothetical protein
MFELMPSDRHRYGMLASTGGVSCHWIRCTCFTDTKLNFFVFVCISADKGHWYEDNIDPTIACSRNQTHTKDIRGYPSRQCTSETSNWMWVTNCIVIYWMWFNWSWLNDWWRLLFMCRVVYLCSTCVVKQHPRQRNLRNLLEDVAPCALRTARFYSLT